MQPLQMLLPLILILVAARLAGMASRRIGMPAVLGELLAGLILGPSVLGLVQMNETLEGIAYIGVLLLMFIAGLETDTAQMLKVGKASTFGAIGGVVLPFGAGVALGMASGMPAPATLFLAAALTATSVSVSVQVLQEVGQLRSRAGMVILGAAITDDVLGLLALSLVMSFVGQGESIAVTILRLVLFFPIAIIVGRFALGPVVRWIARNHSEEAGIALIVAVVLFYAWSAEAWGGLAAITGAYVAGVMLGRLTEAREWIGKSVSILGYGLFIPVFFVTVGLSTNLQAVLVAPAFAVIVTIAAVVTKALGSGVGARLGGCTWAESRTIGAGMVARGEVALVVASLGLNSGLISNTVFTLIIVMTMVTTLLTPLLLKLTLAAPAEGEQAQGSVTLAPVAIEADGA